MVPTGDRGYLDADGYLWLVGPDQGADHRGGEKISRARSTRCCSRIPRWRSRLLRCAARDWGEEVAAAVVLRDPVTETDLLTYAASTWPTTASQTDSHHADDPAHGHRQNSARGRREDVRREGVVSRVRTP